MEDATGCLDPVFNLESAKYCCKQLGGHGRYGSDTVRTSFQRFLRAKDYKKEQLFHLRG
jgi:hypothetical protein